MNNLSLVFCPLWISIQTARSSLLQWNTFGVFYELKIDYIDLKANWISNLVIMNRPTHTEIKMMMIMMRKRLFREGEIS